jgi:hypothetical protein
MSYADTFECECVQSVFRFQLRLVLISCMQNEVLYTWRSVLIYSCCLTVWCVSSTCVLQTLLEFSSIRLLSRELDFD